MAMNDFEYLSVPLPKENDIRILHIEPGNSPNIVGRLAVWNGTETYEALSWQWGLQPPDSSIYIKDAVGRLHSMRIKPNLEKALKQLRLLSEERRLWIDALCINQRNYIERSAQVSMMTDIYGNASNVCIWLGDETEDSVRGMDFVEKIVKFKEFDSLVVLENNKYHADWTALANLMKKDWFSRRWVVQEIALAKEATIHCGSKVVDWSEFADAVALFETVETQRNRIINQLLKGWSKTGHVPEYLGEVSALPASRLVQSTNDLFRKGTDGSVQAWQYSLEALVSNMSPFQASRPHDVIYAVLGLASDIRPQTLLRLNEASGNQRKAIRLRRNMDIWQLIADPKLIEEFPVDYTRSELEIFKLFLHVAIKKSGSLDIICRPWAPEDGYRDDGTHYVINNIPSWIPRLSGDAFASKGDGKMERCNPDTLVGPATFGRKTYNAAGSDKLFCRVTLGPNLDDHRMLADGFILDSIQKVHDPAIFGNIPGRWLESGGWKDGKQLPPEQLWRTLVADRGPKGSNTPRWYPRAFLYAAELYSIKRGFQANKLINESGNSIVSELFRRVQAVVWDRKLIHTEGLYTESSLLGLAPLDTDRGDLICILYGCSVPVALRPRKSEEEVLMGERQSYTLIGECYLHGMMDGEAVAFRMDHCIPRMRFELW